MNNKAAVVTYLPFKSYIKFVGIIIILFLIYYLFILKSAGLIKIPSSCPKGIIPDRVLYQNYSECIKGYATLGPRPDCNIYWEDGTKMNLPYPLNGRNAASVIYCKKGYSEGENLNYLYCDEISYVKEQISSDGTIGKTLYYRIDLVLNPLENNTDGYKVVSHKCVRY